MHLAASLPHKVFLTELGEVMHRRAVSKTMGSLCTKIFLL